MPGQILIKAQERPNHTHTHTQVARAGTHTQSCTPAHTHTHTHSCACTHTHAPHPHPHHTVVTYHSSWHVSLRNIRRTERGNVVAHACTRYGRQLQRGIYGTQIKRRFTHLFCDTCCAGIRAGKFRNGHQVELRGLRGGQYFDGFESADE